MINGVVEILVRRAEVSPSVRAIKRSGEERHQRLIRSVLPHNSEQFGST